MTEPIQIHEYENGLALVTQRMDWVESAAFSLLVPAGCSRDPRQLLGLGNITCEMVQRGCGPRDSRQFVNDLENLGVDHSRLGIERSHESGRCHAGGEAGGSVGDPRGPGATSASAGRATGGRPPGVHPGDSCVGGRPGTAGACRNCGGGGTEIPSGGAVRARSTRCGASRSTTSASFFAATYRPNGAILSVAGNIDFPRLRDQVGQLFAEWQAGSRPRRRTRSPAMDRPGTFRTNRIRRTSRSAMRACPTAHPDYYQARAAVGVLSDGMSSRLFTEVREKRGLVLRRLRGLPYAARSRVRVLLCRDHHRTRPGDARRRDSRTAGTGRRAFARTNSSGSRRG